MSTSNSAPYVARDGWDSSNRILKWFQGYTDDFFDGRDFSPSNIARYHTSDYSFSKAGGESASGREASWEVIKTLFGPFKAHHHEPHFAVVTKEGDGKWMMVGLANAYFNLPGESKEGESKVQSKDGRKWDVCAPSAYKFLYQEDEKAEIGGLLLSRTEVYNDSMPIMKMMGERGLM
jgi:hypothetical protein